jgi:hypothetical protein
MSVFAFIVAGLAFAGALAAWIVGAWLYARTRPDASASRTWLAIAAWPFASTRLKGAAVARPSELNKALVAFIACLTVAFAATSVATNLARVSR